MFQRVCKSKDVTRFAYEMDSRYWFRSRIAFSMRRGEAKSTDPPQWRSGQGRGTGGAGTGCKAGYEGY